jgi:hypothetical protein
MIPTFMMHNENGAGYYSINSERLTAALITFISSSLFMGVEHDY